MRGGRNDGETERERQRQRGLSVNMREQRERERGAHGVMLINDNFDNISGNIPGVQNPDT